ncbi:iron-containing redox enzyme family protein [Streptomyces sp. NPDC048825]|uniref:iron-containing redox enzyme family protein n=1 Tax=Streptomyces sp. NPDC048825 TaxID=3365592 RepID=UPI003711ABB3
MDSSVATQVSTRGSEPVVPEPRGPLSSAVLSTLIRQPPGGPLPLHEVAHSDPYGEDLQLALYACYELHYRGFLGVDPDWEWDPELLRLRGAMECVFHEALREDVAGGDSPDDLDRELDALLAEPREPRGVSQYLKRDGTREQLREYFAHRSVYQLKEADPQAWVIPRLEGPAKAALVAVEYDEFGGGRAERVHARLFADLMAEAGLDPTYGRYVDATPAVTLATVNLMSYLGLHRAQRAALVGHFAAAEITTAPTARRMVDAIDRLGAGPACRFFYSEHVEADAVHEQVLRRDVIGGLLDAEPALLGDVVFGVQATGLLDDRMERHLLDCWRDGRTSLRERGL